MHGAEADSRERARAHLQEQKLSAQRVRVVDTVRSQAKILVRLQPPPVARVDVSIEGSPVRGAAKTPATLVQLSDFRCPFCKRPQATLMQIVERYSQNSGPFSGTSRSPAHPQTRSAAEAARCAQDQEKFWDYQDLLYAEAPKASGAGPGVVAD